MKKIKKSSQPMRWRKPLLSCAHCGSIDIETIIGDGNYEVRCRNCWATCGGLSVEDMVEKWNMRSSITGVKM